MYNQIIENEQMEKILQYNRLSHAYLIESDESEQNQQLILNFIKQIFIKDIDNNFQEKEKIFHLIDINSYGDFRIIEPSGNTIKKEQLIELQREYNNTSINNGKRIYMIKSAEKLTVSASNTILKFLEEPAPNIVAILITSNRYKILPTILSRCQIISLNREVVNGPSEYESQIEELYNLLLNEKNIFLKRDFILQEIMVDKQSAINILKEVEIRLFLYYKKMLSSQTNLDTKRVIKIIKKIETNKQRLEYNVNYKLWLDAFLVEVMEVNNNV